MTFNIEGSSPLARGTLPFIEQAGTPVGLIPARAGNTLHRAKKTNTPGAHPRSRGEHSQDSGHNNRRLGSSPLARGTPIYKILKPTDFGLIPARAGNTGCALGRPRLGGAHPRSRGEHCMCCPEIGGV